MSDSGFFKENTRRLKTFPGGYVGNFFRNLADNIDNFTASDFYSRIAADADLPRELYRIIFWPLLTLPSAFRLTLTTT